jgi:hypothetical protein
MIAVPDSRERLLVAQPLSSTKSSAAGFHPVRKKRGQVAQIHQLLEFAALC